ncbi:TetR/AcrR family transcriptional regulator [Streptomyces sp. MAR4 CNX-425]|uniref:TetR/AcrR family transcriptional regulator n=1 Tax=Streptomyces sp. MAR4 CNX-425 TaxID=3406343 RepID=UPI003B50F192
MRSVSDDRTTRVVIRDEALRLFAERDPDAVSVRQVAAAAGVSPALVVHHYGGKEGLRREVDTYVVETFEALFGELTDDGAAVLTDPGAGGTLSEALLRHLPAGSPLAAYLRRLLLSGGEASRSLFRSLFEVSRRTLDGLAAAGVATRGRDPQVRTAFLLANDLAVFLLRDQLTEVLGTDPLSVEGVDRWAPEMLAIYGGGLLAAPVAGREGQEGREEHDGQRERTDRDMEETA